MMYLDDVMLVIGVGLLAAALLTVRSIIRLLRTSSKLRRYAAKRSGRNRISAAPHETLVA